jgi:hypothetical protein
MLKRFPFITLLLFLHLSMAEGDGGGATPPATPPTPNPTPTPPATPPAPDIQAEIAKALQKQSNEFAERFKQATGHATFDEFQTEQAKAKGESAKLLDQRTVELAQAKAETERLTVSQALIMAATHAVDPDVVQALLGNKAKVENGVVTIGGKAVAEAVAELLAQKPYLAKAGPAGSGAPQGAGGAERNPWGKEHFNLTEQGQIAKADPARAERLRLAAKG